jgi:DNA-binding NarL/FixJ family response regulator
MLDANKSKYIFLFEEAASGSEGIEKIKKNKYDMVIMDYQMPDMNGAETTREMVKLKPNINILALSNYDETLMIKDILNAGAKGYMLKNIDSDELIKAISIILSGKNYYSNEVAVKLIHANDDSIKDEKNPSKKNLSSRELDVLKLIAEAYTNKEIAEKLFLSKRTVESYRQNLLEKIQVKNTAGLLMQAKKLKLID